jgi:curved DNA-binding protein CbpA
MGAEGAVTEGAGAEGAGALGSEGVDGVVAVGNGRGTDGTETVTEGTVGTGTRSARASLARSPPPRQSNATAAAFIPTQLISSRFGCGPTGSARSRGKVAVVKRDYYEVLGISREADDEAIRRAFHELAREWHPDVADVEDAEARFRELAEAYSVLSKREARLRYDRHGYRGSGNQSFDEAMWRTASPPFARGENVHLEMELRSFEADHETRRIVRYEANVRCKACMGRGSVGLPDPECEVCGGTGRKRAAASLVAYDLLQDEPCSACLGEPCSRCFGEGTVPAERRIRVIVPAGVEDGTQLRVTGDGNDAGAGSIPGDLLVWVSVVPPPRDPRVVRYVAFALLLVAVATLALYLIR